MDLKYQSDALEVLASRVQDGMTIAVGGFGLSGNPTRLIHALRDTGAKDLTIVSNNMGIDGKGLGILLENRQVSKVISSYVGENSLFAEQFLSGELDVEFSPRSEEHTSELQTRGHLVCRLLLEKKKVNERKDR